MRACLLCRRGRAGGDDCDSGSDDDESNLFGRLTPYQCVPRRAAGQPPPAAATPSWLSTPLYCWKALWSKRAVWDTRSC